MIQIIAIAFGVLILIALGFFAWAMIEKSLANKNEAEKKAALEDAVANGKVIINENLRSQSIVDLKNKQQAEQVNNETRLSEGDREELNSANF